MRVDRTLRDGSAVGPMVLVFYPPWLLSYYS